MAFELRPNPIAAGRKCQLRGCTAPAHRRATFRKVLCDRSSNALFRHRSGRRSGGAHRSPDSETPLPSLIPSVHTGLLNRTIQLGFCPCRVYHHGW